MRSADSTGARAVVSDVAAPAVPTIGVPPPPAAFIPPLVLVELPKPPVPPLPAPALAREPVPAGAALFRPPEEEEGISLHAAVPHPVPPTRTTDSTVASRLHPWLLEWASIEQP